MDASQAALSATAYVGHLRLDFERNTAHVGWTQREPYVFVQATRQDWTGHVYVDPLVREVSGSNPQRQDYKLGPSRARSFRGYFVSRFSHPFSSYGLAPGGNLQPNTAFGTGVHLDAYVKFAAATDRVEVRTGVSFVSVEQTRRNLDIEAPDGISFESTVERLEPAWLDKLGRVSTEGVNHTTAPHDPRTIWYTSLFHALQYPSDFSEPTTAEAKGVHTFYSGYTDGVHTARDSYYQSWSIWDTYRAEHSLLTLFAPERFGSMLRSLLRIFDWSGRLPIWANVVERNIMIRDARRRRLCERPNPRFPRLQRLEIVGGGEKERVRAAGAGSRAAVLRPQALHAVGSPCRLVGLHARRLRAERPLSRVRVPYAGLRLRRPRRRRRGGARPRTRIRSAATLGSKNYKLIWSEDRAFVQARNANGTWAGPEWGSAEGDEWIYSFNVLHYVRALAALFGGRAALKAKLDEHFENGHNDHANEPSHHVPYLYAIIGYAAAAQRLVRAIAAQSYNATPAGLAGNEDCGQMSAWYVFSALGFYPVNSASNEYVVAAPFFEKVTLRLPVGIASGGRGGEQHGLVVSAPGASSWPYVRTLKVDGKRVEKPGLRHTQIVTARKVEFEIADGPQDWGPGEIWV